MFKLIDMTEYTKSLPTITSSSLFLGNDRTRFDSNGLFSEVIFGPMNSSQWKNKEAKINLKCKVLNPVIYKLLYRLNQKLFKALEDDIPFYINENGTVITQLDKQYNSKNIPKERGIAYIIKHWRRLKFEDNTEIRKKLITYITDIENDDKIFLNFILVVPPGYRPIYGDVKDKNVALMYDELNDLYIKLIKSTNKQIEVKDEEYSTIYDYLIQKQVNNIYKYILNKSGKKFGIIRGQLLGKRTDHSARSVITGDPNLKPDVIGLPLRIVVDIYRPFFIYHIRNSLIKNWDELTREYGGNSTIVTIENVLNAISRDFKVNLEVYEYIKNIAIELSKKLVILFKRDPAIHRESWQAYKFQVIDGATITMNSLSVGAHNADFDGDTVAIYGLLSSDAQMEAANKMKTTHSAAGLFSPIKGFGQDSILGLYTLTKLNK